MEQVLSRAIDDLEPTLTHNGYDAIHSPASSTPTRPISERFWPERSTRNTRAS